MSIYIYIENHVYSSHIIFKLARTLFYIRPPEVMYTEG